MEGVSTMKQKKLVVHFGAGALGRGLVVPMLYESGYRIVLADTNPMLIEKMKDAKSYTLDVSDDEQQRLHTIKIEDIVSPVTDEAMLLAYLHICDAVTTSVRRENLIHVAKVLAMAWGTESDSRRMVLCCENVEGVGAYFHSLLMDYAKNEQQRKNLSVIRIPDTIVDRICAAGSTIMEVTSESFHECSVDADVVTDTGIAKIPSITNIRSHFYRKRYLLNTYADAMAFLALEKQHTYLYEAAKDEEIQNKLDPYIRLLIQLLKAKYGIAMKESEHWFQLYRKRLSNPEIPRELHTVARSLWSKMTLSERFICPLIELIHLHIDVSDGLAVIQEIIESQAGREGLTDDEVHKKLQDLWGGTEYGRKLLEMFIALE